MKLLFKSITAMRLEERGAPKHTSHEFTDPVFGLSFDYFPLPPQTFHLHGF